MRKILLVFLLVLSPVLARAQPFPDGTEFLASQWTWVHLVNLTTNWMTVGIGPGTNSMVAPGAVVVLKVKAATFANGEFAATTADDGTELWYVQWGAGQVSSWFTPAPGSPTGRHWHLLWVGFGALFATYCTFGLVMRVVKKTVNHGAGL